MQSHKFPICLALSIKENTDRHGDWLRIGCPVFYEVYESLLIIVGQANSLGIFNAP
jgi:hypothetical protein